MFWSTVTQVVPVDSKHTVVDAQTAVPLRQASFQQVEDEDAVLVGPAHELDTQLLVGRAFQQHHVQTVVSHAATGARVQQLARLRHVMVVVVMVRAVTVALFAQHGQPEQHAGALQSRHGVAVRDVRDVDAVHLTDVMEIEEDVAYRR